MLEEYKVRCSTKLLGFDRINGIPFKGAYLRQQGIDIMGLGSKIAKIRSERGMTQKELASKALVNANYLASIEEGRRKPHLKLIARLARVLGVAIEDLIQNDTK